MSPVPAALVAHGRTVAEPRLAPDASSVAVMASAFGTTQLVCIPLGADGSLAGPEAPLTSDPAPVGIHPYGGGAHDWLPDSSGLVFVARDGTLHRVGRTGAPPSPIAQPLPGTSIAAPAVSPDGRWVAYVVDGPDRSAVAVAPTDPAAGWPVRLSRFPGPDFAADPTWAPDGTALSWHEWDVPAMPWDAGRIVVAPFDPGSGRAGPPSVITGGNGLSVGQPRYSPDGAHLAYVSDLHGWKNVHVCELASANHRLLAAESFEHADPTWGQGQRSFAWSPVGDAIAFNRNEAGYGRLCVADLRSGAVRELGKAHHIGLSWRSRPDGPAGGLIAAIRSGGRTPNQLVVYDVASGGRTTVARGPLPGWDAVDLPEPEIVHWAADDGETIHGRLYRPIAGTAGPGSSAPPMMVSVHGGPTDQTRVVFAARFAFWQSRGWAILVPDHRGSSGWGRAYQQAMAGKWGVLDVEDTAAGIRHAVAHGWCDPRRVVIMGGSAGGFTVLGMLARHPDLCAAGVDLFGVADLLDLDETTHRYEKHYLHSIVGALPEHVQRYRERSPVHLADRITAPLLILQGEDDRVVPPAQSRTIAEAVRRRGGTVETHFYDGEGHGWSKPATVIDELNRTEDFLRRHVLRWRV